METLYLNKLGMRAYLKPEVRRNTNNLACNR